MKRVLFASILVLLISGTASANGLSEALDTNLSCTTTGDAAWFAQMAIAYFDGDAAQSGDIGNSRNSLIQTAVSGTGTVSFFWKVIIIETKCQCAAASYVRDGSRPPAIGLQEESLDVAEPYSDIWFE
ncbi:MAG: hypothetical protein RQ760_08965 [Sedimentisphaerales bacterium]|nr:hypothetical protein [Sedimentisphaerales bacterium]